MTTPLRAAIVIPAVCVTGTAAQLAEGRWSRVGDGDVDEGRLDKYSYHE